MASSRLNFGFTNFYYHNIKTIIPIYFRFINNFQAVKEIIMTLHENFLLSPLEMKNSPMSKIFRKLKNFSLGSINSKFTEF